MADRMIAVVFDNRPDAYRGRAALQQLDSDGTIALYASAVVWKHGDGTVTVDDKEYAPPLATMTATPISSLIGLAGGPAGLAAGAIAGLLVGTLVDDGNARAGEDFATDVSRALSRGNVAVVAQVDEESATPLDTRMTAIGGTVFRRALSDVRAGVSDAEMAAMKSDARKEKNT